MINENCNYAKQAAIWWTDKIKSTSDGIIKGISSFESLLETQIKNTVSLNGSMDISTYSHRSNLLDSIAAKTYLSADIPSGYEMKIVLEKVYVYNSTGMLEACF